MPPLQRVYRLCLLQSSTPMGHRPVPEATAAQPRPHELCVDRCSPAMKTSRTRVGTHLSLSATPLWAHWVLQNRGWGHLHPWVLPDRDGGAGRGNMIPGKGEG